MLKRSEKFTIGLPQVRIGHTGNSLTTYRVAILTTSENVCRLAPPNLLGLAPPKFSKCWSHIHFARHLDVFRSLGGQSGTLMIF